MQTNNKLRETMLSIRADILKRRSENVWYITDSDILEKINSALAEPVKNCEVGTAEELYGRYEKFCCSHFNNEGDNCLKCPFSRPTCKFAWAQMPYESEAANGE